MTQSMSMLHPGGPNSDLLWPPVWMTGPSGPRLVHHKAHLVRLKADGWHEIAGPEAAPAPPDALALAHAEIASLKAQLAQAVAPKSKHEKET